MIAPKCLATLLLVSASSVGSTEDQNLSADELMAVIQTNLSKFESIKFQFRAQHREMHENVPFRDTFALWVYRNDGNEFLKLKDTTGSLAGQEQSHSRTHESNRSLIELGVGQRKAAAIETPRREWEVHMAGMPRRFFVLPYLLEREDRIRKNYVAEGWENVDGHRCFKFSEFTMRDPARPEIHRRERYWLDLERGGHALRWQWWVNGSLRSEMANVQLQPLEGGLWMPVQSREEHHWKWKGRPHSKASPDLALNVASGGFDPTKDHEKHVVVNATVDTATIEVNVPIENHEIEISFPTGTQVLDQIDGRQFFVGGVQPKATGARTPPPTAESLDEVVAKAESQRRTIEASSLQRSGWGAWTIALMAGLSALLIVGGILLMQRRGA